MEEPAQVDNAASSCRHSIYIHAHSHMHNEIKNDDGKDVEDTFLTDLAQLYLLLPAPTLQSLTEQFQVVDISNMELIFSKVRI